MEYQIHTQVNQIIFLSFFLSSLPSFAFIFVCYKPFHYDHSNETFSAKYFHIILFVFS